MMARAFGWEGVGITTMNSADDLATHNIRFDLTDNIRFDL